MLLKKRYDYRGMSLCIHMTRRNNNNKKKKKTNHQTLWHFFDYSYSYLLGKLIIDLLPPCFFKPKLLIDLLDE